MSSRLDDLYAWRIFVTLAKTGSVSLCAQVMNLEPSSISRAIASLEKGIGQALIRHNSRPMELTDAGRKALTRMEPGLRAHQQLIASLFCRIGFCNPPFDAFFGSLQRVVSQHFH